jgi:hypothetical protein
VELILLPCITSWRKQSQFYVFTVLFISYCISLCLFTLPFVFVFCLLYSEEVIWDLVLVTARKQYLHKKTRDSILYQKNMICYEHVMIRILLQIHFTTYVFFNSDYFFLVFIRLSCSSVIIGKWNKIIFTACEIRDSRCLYEIYCPLRLYILYYANIYRRFRQTYCLCILPGTCKQHMTQKICYIVWGCKVVMLRNVSSLEHKINESRKGTNFLSNRRRRKI